MNRSTRTMPHLGWWQERDCSRTLSESVPVTTEHISAHVHLSSPTTQLILIWAFTHLSSCSFGDPWWGELVTAPECQSLKKKRQWHCQSKGGSIKRWRFLIKPPNVQRWAHLSSNELLLAPTGEVSQHMITSVCSDLAHCFIGTIMDVSCGKKTGTQRYTVPSSVTSYCNRQ